LGKRKNFWTIAFRGGKVMMELSLGAAAQDEKRLAKGQEMREIQEHLT
jgi:hypothetical protein